MDGGCKKGFRPLECNRIVGNDSILNKSACVPDRYLSGRTLHPEPRWCGCPSSGPMSVLRYHLLSNRFTASLAGYGIPEIRPASPSGHDLYTFFSRGSPRSSVSTTDSRREMSRPRFFAVFRLFLNFPDRINSYFIDPIPLMPQKNCRIVWYQDLGLYILLLA